MKKSIDKVSKADVDRYVTPFGKKTITMKLGAGSQSLSIVGQSVIMTRGTKKRRNRYSRDSVSPWFPISSIQEDQAGHDHSPSIKRKLRGSLTRPPARKPRSPVSRPSPTRILKCASGLARPVALEGDSSSRIDFIPRAISKTFSGLTSSAASPSTSGSDDVLDASTGVRLAMASSGGKPKPS